MPQAAATRLPAPEKSPARCLQKGRLGTEGTSSRC